MIILGNNNKIEYDTIQTIRIENARDDNYNLVAYSLGKNNVYKKVVLGKYKFWEYAQSHLRRIYTFAENKEKICQVG